MSELRENYWNWQALMLLFSLYREQFTAKLESPKLESSKGLKKYLNVHNDFFLITPLSKLLYFFFLLFLLKIFNHFVYLEYQ